MTEDHHDEPTYENSGIPQPYHLVRPSVWPLLGAIAAGLMMAGMVMFMHKIKLALRQCCNRSGARKFPLIGLAMAFWVIMFVWWRDIIRESTFEKAHTPIVGIGLRCNGMAPVYRLRSDVLLGFLLGLLRRRFVPAGIHRRNLAAREYQDFRSIRYAVHHDADPAAVGNHVHMGASCRVVKQSARSRHAASPARLPWD